MDACFTQKRRKSQGKAWAVPRQHCETVFVSPEEVQEAEHLVDSIRPQPKGKSKRNAKSQPLGHQENSDVEPDYEPGMQIPSSVLNDCNDSFVAADSNCVKASTLFFADTGLMALLCRHDCVLWLANMTSAGEKQHYVLCLLNKLFQHIPQTMRIGVLYDIGCQLDRSCEKFDFLSNVCDCIIFGISVFHAYGHQWPCQLIYHPRKCEGFGLSDGEGCERFWSSIKPLIPSLRVSTYFNRIYTLDTKVRHLDNKSLLGLGHWLKRRWIKTMHRKNEATEVLAELLQAGISQEILHAEWVKQVVEQTKPLKKQSKHLANIEIEGILALYKNIENYNEEIDQYEMMLEKKQYEKGFTAADVQGFLEELERKVKNQKRMIAARKTTLSVDGRLNLTKLLDNQFLKLRMNALALKKRIRDRLRHRKFELENLERAYRKTINHIKLEKHAQTQLKCKEPGIQTLARKYNVYCVELENLITLGHAPRGAIALLSIEMDGLFKLDVDDDIWQDIGLTDDLDDASDIPDWLGDDKVHAGIKVMLEHDRCIEEIKRIIHERVCMQEWFSEEWRIVQQAINITTDKSIVYQLKKREDYLLQICVIWQKAIKGINCKMSEEWGPSWEQLHKTRQYEFQEQVLIKSDTSGDELENDELEEEEEEDMEDADFVDSLEISALVDEFRTHQL